jgi:hypothetical protein
MKTLRVDSKQMRGAASAPGIEAHGWQRWAPSAATAWSLLYGVLGIYWAVSGRGFPYASETTPGSIEPLVGQFGPAVAWVVVILAGIPAAVMGAAMLRGVRGRLLRPLFIAAGLLLAGSLLLLMTDANLLILVGYIPYVVRSLFTGAGFGQKYLAGWMQWATIHQLLCIAGGFLWLAATVCYIHRSGNACLYCGRRDGPEGWQSPKQAARWGRTAVYAAMAAPVFYAITRFAWALGYRMGLSEETLRSGQADGTWISGLFLAAFGLVGALLMLGLVQRWGEVFPRWMVGLAGRPVPIALAIVPASLVSVLLIVGGVTILSGLPQMIANVQAAGLDGTDVAGEIISMLGPIALFPVWGAALAVAALGYYYRRRGPCSACGRGAPGEIGKPTK